MNNNFKNKVSLVFLMLFTVVSFSFLLVNFSRAEGGDGNILEPCGSDSDCGYLLNCWFEAEGDQFGICGPGDGGVAESTTPNSGVNNTSNTSNSGSGSSVVSLNNPLGNASIPGIIGKVINAVLGIVGSLALIMFIYGGITWMTAAGNEQNVTKGKNIIIWATLGLVVIFSSYAIVRFVLQAIGV